MKIRLHPKQSLVFDSPARQMLFGGAAGPGKSFVLRVVAMAWALGIPGLQVYLFRKSFPDLYKNHMEGPTGFPVLLADWFTSKRASLNRQYHYIRFDNGSRIFLAHIQHDTDLDKIQGAEIHVALIDELTHLPKHHYAYIRSRVRMVGIKVPAHLHPERFPRIVTASNPGSVGHHWVKALFIDPAPPGSIWQAPPSEGGFTTQFIPALLSDNPSMALDDPDYEMRLHGLGAPHLVRAMLEGDWNIAPGGYFDDVWVPDVHVVPYFAVPESWRVDRTHDWGESRPFATLWFAESNGEVLPDGRRWPKGTLFVIAEDYGWNGNPNEGLRLTAGQIALRVRQVEARMDLKQRIHPGPADLPAMRSGQSLEQEMAQAGVRWLPPDKGPGSRVTGWSKIRTALFASLQDPMEAPGLFVFDTCRQLIRTLPVLPRDEKDPDDVDSLAEDHCGDALRMRLVGARRQAGIGKLRV